MSEASRAACQQPCKPGGRHRHAGARAGGLAMGLMKGSTLSTPITLHLMFSAQRAHKASIRDYSGKAKLRARVALGWMQSM